MDIPSLVKSLNENNVRYLIIGATAFPVHGYARATLDTDIFIQPTIKNVQKTLKALKEFGYDVTDITIDDLLNKKLLIRGYIVQTDIHPSVKGVKNFEEVWEKRVKGKILGVPSYFVDLDSLINMKQAAGRPKDLEDLKYLQEIQKQKKSSPKS